MDKVTDYKKSDNENIKIKKKEMFDLFIKDTEGFISSQKDAAKKDSDYADSLVGSNNSELKYNDKNDDYHEYLSLEALKYYQLSEYRLSLAEELSKLIKDKKSIKPNSKLYEDICDCLYNIYLLNCNVYTL